MFPLLINLLVMLAVFGIIYVIISRIPFPPEFAFIKSIVLLILALIAIFYLLGLVGVVEPFGFPYHRIN